LYFIEIVFEIGKKVRVDLLRYVSSRSKVKGERIKVKGSRSKVKG